MNIHLTFKNCFVHGLSKETAEYFDLYLDFVWTETDTIPTLPRAVRGLAHTSHMCKQNNNISGENRNHDHKSERAFLCRDLAVLVGTIRFVFLLLFRLPQRPLSQRCEVL